MGLKYSSFAIRGIDVSVFNGVIDWSKIQANFSGIRVGYGRTIDAKFQENWINAKGKVNRIPYWYMDFYSNHIEGNSANGMSDAAWGSLQADNCWAQLKSDPEGSVMLDIESTNGGYAPKIETVFNRAQNIAKAFIGRMDSLNKKRNGIYCSLGLLHLFDAWFKDRPLWVAWYPYRKYNTSPVAIVQEVISAGWNCKPLIWQYASDGDIDDNGIKSGISYFGTQMDEMDLNGWVGTQKEYEQLFNTTVTIPVEPPVIIPEPEETITTMSVKRLVSLRNAPIINQSTFVTLLPAGTQLECIDKKVEGKNTWRKVSFWVAENYNGIQYLK